MRQEAERAHPQEEKNQTELGLCYSIGPVNKKGMLLARDETETEEQIELCSAELEKQKGNFRTLLCFRRRQGMAFAVYFRGSKKYKGAHQNPE